MNVQRQALGKQPKNCDNHAHNSKGASIDCNAALAKERSAAGMSGKVCGGKNYSSLYLDFYFFQEDEEKRRRTNDAETGKSTYLGPEHAVAPPASYCRS